MKVLFQNGKITLAFVATALTFASLCVAYQASSIPASRLINPDELVKILQSSRS